MDKRRIIMMQHMREKRRMTLKEIGDEFDISRERVRQLIGNTGRRNSKSELHEHIADLRRSVFLEERDTPASIAKRYHLAESTVRIALGARWRYLLGLGLRKCYRCKIIKTIDQFGIANSRYKEMNISGVCKECNSEQASFYYRAKKSKQKRAARQSKTART